MKGLARGCGGRVGVRRGCVRKRSWNEEMGSRVRKRGKKKMRRKDTSY